MSWLITSGGVATAGSVRRNPITMVESGPAAGIFAAASIVLNTLVVQPERALVGIQSAAGYEEGKALPVGW